MIRARLPIALIAAAAVLGGCASDQRPTLDPAPAAPPTSAAPTPDDVKAGIRKGLASIRNFRAEVVAKHNQIERRARFEMTAEGAVRETSFGPEGERATVTDAARGIWRGAPGQPAGRPPEVDVRPGVVDNPLLVARHVLDWDQFGVVSTTVDGLPAWVVQWSAPRGSNPDYVTVTIDVRSGLARRAEGFFENQPVYDVHVVTLEIDTDISITLPPITVPQPPPGRGPLVTSDPATRAGAGREYVPTTIEEAGTLAGYRPVVPTWLPSGFVAAEVAFAVQARSSTAFTNPDATHIVSAAYRRGLDELVITTRRRGSRPWRRPSAGVDPIEPPNEQPSPRIVTHRFESAVVSAGAFAGAEADRSTRFPYGQSLFWALTDELNLEIRGDVTVDEMQRIVDSLKRL